MRKLLKYIAFAFWIMISLTARAQQTDALIRKGNRFYKAQDFDRSKEAYEKALKQSPGNANANFNLGNAEFRKNDFDKSAAGYDEVLKANTDPKMREDAFYNKGVAMIRQKKLQESIEAWKKALLLNPDDQEARDNLIKALREKKQQQQQQQNNDNKKDKNQKQDKQNQKQQEKQQEDNKPKPQQSKLSKQQVDQYLRSLIQREKDVQDKMNQNRTHTPDQPEKDW
ncbi:MAG TPA: tetratricopeptide repeat protein [Puia sp.]|nr:tetratricopeptide repeat protein [Puia sp.]